MGSALARWPQTSEVSKFFLQMFIYKLIKEGGFVKALHPRYENHYSASNFQASNH